MIFIKDKKAWKEFVNGLDVAFNVPAPVEYPCYADKKEIVDSVRSYSYVEYIYREDLESMIAKIDSGREF